MRGLSEYPGSQLHMDIAISLQFIFSNYDTVHLFLKFHMLLNLLLVWYCFKGTQPFIPTNSDRE